MSSKLNILARIFALLGAVFLLSCRETAQEDGPRSTTPPPAAPSAKLSLLSWPDYLPQDVLKRFEARHGVEIEVTTYHNKTEARSLVSESPQKYDVILTGEDTQQELWQRGLLLKLNHQQLPNQVNLGKYAGLAFDPERLFSMPYMWGTTLVVYNTKLVQSPPKSWSLLWDSRALGRHPVMMLDEPRELLAIALYSMNRPMNSPQPEDIDLAHARLLSQLESVNVRYGSLDEVKASLIDGTCAAAGLYSTDAALAARENPDLKPFVPIEGGPLWFDLFSVSRESRQVRLSHAFINYMMEAKVSAECAEFNWAAVPNEAAEKLVNPKLLSDPAVYLDKSILGRCAFHDMSNTPHLGAIEQRMRDLKERAKAGLPQVVHGDQPRAMP